MCLAMYVAHVDDALSDKEFKVNGGLAGLS